MGTAQGIYCSEEEPGRSLSTFFSMSVDLGVLVPLHRTLDRSLPVFVALVAFLLGHLGLKRLSSGSVDFVQGLWLLEIPSKELERCSCEQS